MDTVVDKPVILEGRPSSWIISNSFRSIPKRVALRNSPDQRSSREMRHRIPPAELSQSLVEMQVADADADCKCDAGFHRITGRARATVGEQLLLRWQAGLFPR